ncbi:HTH domain-containing protein [uncultured Enorma sp.]|uniref:BglG family transcription antiterminator n=1 Tax=uncultured Enorma sp. TaxID=1714346 RepID=UPI00280486A2|nr:HTH domain-containing protein [uncultured Enorma sp.]
MKENERKVLHIILERTEPITAVELAAAVGVSERTVRSYVHSINRQAGMTCIESSRKGYWYRIDAARNLLDRESLEAAHASIPQTNAERSAYLVNRVLRSPVPLSTADLAEELFVSTSTMNAVLSRARRHLAPFDLTLVQADGHLSVHGTEKNKRRVLGELLYDEASASFLDVATIQHAFPDIDAARIRETVIDTLDKHRFFVNGYSLVNIVLHIAIAIDRIRNSKASHEESLDKPGTAIIQAHDLAMADEIAENLSEDFCVPFAPSERKELALLLSTRTTHIV